MTKNAQYTKEYLDIIDELDGDIPGREAAFETRYAGRSFDPAARMQPREAKN